MLLYLIAILYILGITYFFRNKNYYFIFLTLTPIILLSSFRGTIGADTKNYILLFEYFNIENNELSILSEPLFYLLIYFSKLVSDKIELFFFLHASIVCFLYSLLISKYNLAKLFLISIGPMFLIDTLTNGMRIGVSYQILALGLIYETNNKRLTLAASMFHISSLIYYLHYKFINPILNMVNRKSLFYFTMLFIVTPILSYFIIQDDRIWNKINIYSEYSSPSILSGLSDLYIILIISICSISRNCTLLNYSIKIFILICMIILLKFFAVYSYAILRIIKLIMLSTIVYCSKSKNPLLANEKFIIIFLFIPYTLNYFMSIYSNPDLYL